jgi:hypothetical protein
MTITVSTADRRGVKALAVLSSSDRWQKGHTKDGRSPYAIPSESEAGLFHLTDTRECSCRDFQRRREPCKHVLACRLKVAMLKAPAPRRAADPAKVAAYDSIFGRDGDGA